MKDDIGHRIGQIILQLGLKKVSFAERLKIDQSYVTQLTNGKRNPSDRLLLAICREFNIDEAWLRTGKGEMLKTTPDMLSSRLAQEYGLDELGRQIMAAYLKLDESDRLAVGRLIQNILSERTKMENTSPGTPAKAPQEMTDEELHAELDRQLSEEKKRVASG